ncbi:hypothetical protein Tco_1544709, partial [Tanacetum coccineum]
MTNKIDTFLKAINDRMTGALPCDKVKNIKLNVNSTSLVLYARSYPMEDTQCSSHIHKSLNAIKTCSKQTSNFQKDQMQTVIKIGTPKPKEPEKALKDECKDLLLNLPVLEVLAYAPMYNVILDKYVESLDLRDSKPFDTLAGLGSCTVKKAKIVVGEGVTRSIFGVKEIALREEELPYSTILGKRESYTPRPSTDEIGT